uniref:Uncharacterized protein n=1 Tax=Lepeophtheirus salmonis TaxID=72036 RepID=A0A0K2TD93_LEPSM
MHTKHLPISTG